MTFFHILNIETGHYIVFSNTRPGKIFEKETRVPDLPQYIVSSSSHYGEESNTPVVVMDTA